MKNKTLLSIPLFLFLILSMSFVFLRVPSLAAIIKTDVISSAQVAGFLAAGNVIWTAYLIILYKKIRPHIQPSFNEDVDVDAGYSNNTSDQERRGNDIAIILAYWFGLLIALVLAYEMFFGYIASDFNNLLPYTFIGVSVALITYLVDKIDSLNKIERSKA